MEDIVYVGMFIGDMNEWPKANKMYSQCIKSQLPPARAFVSTQLPQDIAVQMVVVAHKLISKTQKVIHQTANKEVLYVQSVSNWAPANIGPYSQCVKVNANFKKIFSCSFCELLFFLGERYRLRFRTNSFSPRHDGIIEQTDFSSMSISSTSCKQDFKMRGFNVVVVENFVSVLFCNR